LYFDSSVTWQVAQREHEAGTRYAAALQQLPSGNGRRVDALLRAELRTAWQERRESVFRLIGMLLPPGDVYRAYLSTSGGAAQARANSLEWLEHTLGHRQYEQLAPMLEVAAPEQMAAAAGAAADLSDDGDAWIAVLWQLHRDTDTPNADGTMELVEKVLLLQRVDLLHGARGAHLAMLASIADETEVAAGETIIEAGVAAGAMYVVTRGSVVLHGAGEQVSVGEEEAFGTWSLIDDSASPFAARAAEPSRLLRISRSDFRDLLTDHPELSLALLQGLAQRMRSLVA
jgi:hypothetical protein